MIRGAAPGGTIDQVVELRDLLPTFLDAAGAKTPSGLDGQRLLTLARGDAGRWREFVDLRHSRCCGPELSRNALTDVRFKYVYWAEDGREELLNIANDPGETCNLAAAASHQRTLKTWRERMIETLSERGEKFVSNGKLALRPRNPLYSPNYPDDPNDK